MWRGQSPVLVQDGLRLSMRRSFKGCDLTQAHELTFGRVRMCPFVHERSNHGLRP